MFLANERSSRLAVQLQQFIDECVYPAENMCHGQTAGADYPHRYPVIMATLKDDTVGNQGGRGKIADGFDAVHVRAMAGSKTNALRQVKRPGEAS